jgi:glycosyltransferase involved in cell wall biosynthesis
MKGVQYLPLLAAALKAAGVPFQLSIFGDGPLREALAARASSLGVENQVKLFGAVDFRSELVPRLTESVDLFVCPHVQGDPSCTYLETFSCGVPIVGFLNEAFAGILERTQAGWGTSIGSVSGLTEIVSRIYADPKSLVPRAELALQAGRKHTFEGEFGRRIDQMLSVIE